MSLVLSDLLVCCKGLCHEKATERKREAENFRRLLKAPETVQALDLSSDRAATQQPTWDNVFRFLQRYVQKETIQLQSSKSTVSATALASRQKKMAEMCSLVKYFIRCANKRGPRLKFSDLLKHVMEALMSPYSCSAYAEDYSSLLVKDLLSVRKYCCEISSQQWQELLDFYCGLFNTSSRAMTRVLVTRVIRAVVVGCVLQTDSLHSALFSFFSKALLNARQERHLAVVEHLVSALNVFLRSAAMDRRMRVCGLGEELLPSLLYVWADMKPSPALKEEMVDFFHLQLRVHHPHGVRTPETGAHAEDWNRWRSLLYNLYDALVSEISHTGSRGKYTVGTRHVAVKDNLIELTADICHQLFTEEAGVQALEVTLRSRVSGTEGTPSKRRRVELGWEVLRDHLQPQHSDFDVIPWVQITTVLLSKYPSMLPRGELLPLLSVLCQLLGEQRRGERGTYVLGGYVLGCLRELARCPLAHPDRAPGPRAELDRLWGRVWSLALRAVSSPQTEAPSLGLLAAVVRAGLRSMDRESWKLFSGMACKPSQSAAVCLAQALMKCAVPKRLVPVAGLDCLGPADGPGSQSLKEALIGWLLMSNQSDEPENSVKPHPIVCSDFFFHLMANVLVSLTLKDTRTGLACLLDSERLDRILTQQQAPPNPKDSALGEMESLYQHFSFEAPGRTKPPGAGGPPAVAPSPPPLVPGLRDMLQRALLVVADNLLNSYSPNTQSTAPESLVRCLALLTGVLAGYVSTGALDPEEAFLSPLFSKAKALAQELSDFVSSVKVKMAEDGTMVALRAVMKLCALTASPDAKEHISSVSSRLFSSVLPARLLSELAEICKLLLSSASQTAARTDHHRGEAPQDEFDGFRTQQPAADDGFDLLSDDGPHGSVSNTQRPNRDNAEGGGGGSGAKSLLAEEHLASEDLALLASLEFQCVCASVSPAHSLLFRPQEVRRRLLQLLEHVDFSRALYLHMYLVLLRRLPTEDCLSPEEFDLLLRPLLALCSLYRQDQEVCATVLLGLLPAVRCLGRTRHPAGEMRHAHGVLLQVLSAFCTLAKKKRCTAAVRAALVRCLAALLEADPCCEWAVLTVDKVDFPLSVHLPSHLADAHHHVRMLTAMSVERLFVRVDAGRSERRMLPLQHQQEAFERVYLEAQEEMKSSQSGPSDELRDEAFNRRASLLMAVSSVLRCSPVCEKQALFALLQSHKMNALEDQLIQKVLASVSGALGYRSVKGLVTSHLYYLVAEWLGQRKSDAGYTLESFPYALLGHDSLQAFYSSSCQVLVPHLVFLEDFEQVRSMGGLLGQDWRDLLADCFPRILVNILPYFVQSGPDAVAGEQRARANKVYDLLKDSSCLGKQRMDSLIQSNLADIVVELLMTLYEGAGTGAQQGSSDLQRFTGELDPAPNPPYFSSQVIRATLVYLSRCHGASTKSLVAILSKNPISIQRILLALCEKAAETTNAYERHRILLMYRLLVGLLLAEVQDGLGGAWAFVLRDVIYTLIHHFNSSPDQSDEVSTRSLLLCCDLLAAVCRAALQCCADALHCHLQVIVGTLTAQVTSRPAIAQQVLSLLRFLVVENQEELSSAICRLEPFPDSGEFKELRSVQHQLKYSCGAFTLRQEMEHFLSVTSCDTLPLTRLEGLKELSRTLAQNKEAIRELLDECQEEPSESVLVKLILSLLHLCKMATNHPAGDHILEAAGGCLGELGPLDLSTIALTHGRDLLYTRAVELFPSDPAQGLYILLDGMNQALTHHRIEVKKAAGQCVRNFLGTQTGADFWEKLQDKQDPMLAYLNPFRTAKKKLTNWVAEVPPQEAKERLESQELWVPQAGGHSRWLKTLCVALLDSGGVRDQALLLSRPLCLVRANFCQRALPLVVHSILLGDQDGSWRRLLSRWVQEFFAACCRSSQAPSRSATPLPVESGESDEPGQGSLDMTSLRTMLSVLDYLRHQPRPVDADRASATVCDANAWLELNYLEVARAAQACSAHFTALLYSEIYVDQVKASTEESRRTKSRASRRINFEENSQTFTISSLTERSVEDTGISLQELLMEVYRSIGEPDSLYGCGGVQMSSPLTRIRTYEHEALWSKALSSYDLHSSLPEVTRQVGIVEALQNLGLNGILATYLRGLDSEGQEWGSELRELRFQAAWRTTRWDCELPDRSEKANPGFNECVFGALLVLNDKEFSTFDRTLKFARVAEVEALCGGSLEAASSLYPAARNLQCLRELQSVSRLFSRPVSDAALAEVCGGWARHSRLLADSAFPLVEPVLALRSAALQTLLGRAADPDSTRPLAAALGAHLTELCQLARTSGNTQLAEHAVHQMKTLAGGDTATGAAASSPWLLEEAQVFWAKGERGLALGLLKRMIHTLEGQVDINPALVPIYTESRRLCGNWLAETCLESPGVILEDYLERAVEMLQAPSSATDPRLQGQRTLAFLSLARFSDGQYQTIDKYMNSSEFENKQALLEKAKAEVDLMREHNVGRNRYTVKVQRELEMDEEALSNLRADRRRFLCKAVDNYVHCLAEGDRHDDWVFRLASLWLENADLPEVNAIMKVGVQRIPSHKFLPLMYQLAARMGTQMSSDSSEDTGFHEVLNALILRACLQHPHHTLFIILALVNANTDATFIGSSRANKTAPQQPSVLDLERSEVARKIISAVRKKRPTMLKGMESLCDAYITLAYMDASRHKQEKKPLPIPADQPLMKIRDLQEVSIPTMDIKVDPSGRYDNLVTIRSFQPQYRLAGGVNLPKIIDCVGSDGRVHRQLVKGQDDLRQDAVMQQVFAMCSTLLQRNAETRRRKLRIRRYKVVPLSQRSGVLEWCAGTVPIGDFLVDPARGAHARFRPQDWTNLACRRRMMEAQQQGPDKKGAAYAEVCQNFRPVFRYFCMERFLDPAVWMEKRLAYTRSVATSSIVGYIVGLGDRHIQNILIDEQTAELIHIDLGVAFEQGKVLPTPETVPFRLTRDLVDGMGVPGVEGVFRRCCEKTMEVMRTSQESVVTIVEVLLYDPLFDWTMNPLKAFQLQQVEQQEHNTTLNPTLGPDDMDPQRKASSDSQSFNKVAERVLLRLQEKLKGVEDGAVLSVGGQVNLLIQQAMDPSNLSRLFPGWQAWV